MTFLPYVLALMLNVGPGFHASQDRLQPPPDPTFEGCLAKSATDGVWLLTNARAISGTIVGAGLRFRVIPDTKGIELVPHVNHVVQVTGPVEGTIPAQGKQVQEADLPQIRAKSLAMVSNECLGAR